MGISRDWIPCAMTEQKSAESKLELQAVDSMLVEATRKRTLSDWWLDDFCGVAQVVTKTRSLSEWWEDATEPTPMPSEAPPAFRSEGCDSIASFKEFQTEGHGCELLAQDPDQVEFDPTTASFAEVLAVAVANKGFWNVVIGSCFG